MDAVYELTEPAGVQLSGAHLMAEAVGAISSLPENHAVRALWRRLPTLVRSIVRKLFQPTEFFRGFRSLFRLLPKRYQAGISAWIRPTGLHHCFNYLADYRWTHRPEHFSAAILALREEYWRADEQGKRDLSDRFAHIVDGIVLRNGVKKTTSFARQSAILSRVIPGLKLHRDRITVLDVPSSIGLASLASCDVVSTRWPITSYVLGDLSFEIVYDRDHDCVFDANGDLLQLGGRTGFFSVYRPTFSSGWFANVLSALILSPLHLRSWYVRRRYRVDSSHAHTSIVLLHPEVEKRVKEGVFELQKTDVFSAVEGQYDLILSFNLLVRRYFSRAQIATGIANLAKALNEDGALVIGDDTSHRVFRKMNGQLALVESDGEL